VAVAGNLPDAVAQPGEAQLGGECEVHPGHGRHRPRRRIGHLDDVECREQRVERGDAGGDLARHAGLRPTHRLDIELRAPLRVEQSRELGVQRLHAGLEAPIVCSIGSVSRRERRNHDVARTVSRPASISISTDWSGLAVQRLIDCHSGT
jgi:hypothetical protein